MGQEKMAEKTSADIETELCECMHLKTDHYGFAGAGACSIATLAARTTPVGSCKCARFTWHSFLWKRAEVSR